MSSLFSTCKHCSQQVDLYGESGSIGLHRRGVISTVGLNFGGGIRFVAAFCARLLVAFLLS